MTPNLVGVGNSQTPDCSASISHGNTAKLETLCASFYDNKTEPDTTCKKCIKQSRALDSDCPCAYSNFCQFAHCVNSESDKCKRTYEMIFNTKHKPFEFKDLKNCDVVKKEGFVDSVGISWKPWQWSLLIVLGIALLFVLS